MSIQYKLKFTSIFQICLVCLFFPPFFQKGYWYWILILQFFWHTDTDTYSVFFRLNTDTDTSVFKNHTGYWILVFSFCTGQVLIIIIWHLMTKIVFLLQWWWGIGWGAIFLCHLEHGLHWSHYAFGGKDFFRYSSKARSVLGGIQ